MSSRVNGVNAENLQHPPIKNPGYVNAWAPLSTPVWVTPNRSWKYTWGMKICDTQSTNHQLYLKNRWRETHSFYEVWIGKRMSSIEGLYYRWPSVTQTTLNWSPLTLAVEACTRGWSCTINSAQWAYKSAQWLTDRPRAELLTVDGYQHVRTDATNLQVTCRLWYVGYVQQRISWWWWRWLDLRTHSTVSSQHGPLSISVFKSFFLLLSYFLVPCGRLLASVSFWAHAKLAYNVVLHRILV